LGFALLLGLSKAQMVVGEPGAVTALCDCIPQARDFSINPFGGLCVLLLVLVDIVTCLDVYFLLAFL
jgi:hypothetical protein